jgi:hypothetical protein
VDVKILYRAVLESLDGKKARGEAPDKVNGGVRVQR